MATVTNERYVNFRITDNQGYSRSFKINNVISNSAQLQTALKNFGDNFVMDDEKNILITGRTDENLIGYSADLVVTEKTEDLVTGGEQYPLILSSQELEISTATGFSTAVTVSIPNATGNVTAVTVYQSQIGGDISFTYDQQTQVGSWKLLQVGGTSLEPEAVVIKRLTDADGKTALQYLKVVS